MRTGEVAESAGVNRQTLRYYERRGLLRAPDRRASGYRAYGPDAVRVVRFVKRAQELGFTLTEIEALLELAGGGPDSCEVAQQLAREKMSELDRKIASLETMHSALERLVATCSRPRAERDCPLLRSIDDAAHRDSGS